MAKRRPIVIGEAQRAPVILCGRGTCRTPSLCFEKGERCQDDSVEILHHEKR